MSKRICGQTINASEAYNYWLDSNIYGEKRSSKDAFDFGDIATVGKCLKRRYLNFHQFKDDDFGIYLGEHNGKWVIAHTDIAEGKIVSGEVFESLGDLKEAWQLD